MKTWYSHATDEAWALPHTFHKNELKMDHRLKKQRWNYKTIPITILLNYKTKGESSNLRWCKGDLNMTSKTQVENKYSGPHQI